MAVTVKKKSLSVKKPGQEAPAAEATAEPAAPVPSGKQPSYLLSGIAAILACICFIILLAIQWMEFSSY
jgi:hypothetical protein